MRPTVLVIDDEPDILMLLRIDLEREGFRVLDARSAEEAATSLRVDEPDAMLLDLRLPGQDGWSLLEELRSSGRLERIPVIVISAHADPSAAERAMAMGCRGYIEKPFDSDDVIAALNRVLAQR
jgi:CheY-like chemotaxis protein